MEEPQINQRIEENYRESNRKTIKGGLIGVLTGLTISLGSTLIPEIAEIKNPENINLFGMLIGGGLSTLYTIRTVYQIKSNKREYDSNLLRVTHSTQVRN